VSKEVAVLVTVAAGGLVAAQAPANNVLSDRVGTGGAVSVNFIVGTICVLFVTFALAGGITVAVITGQLTLSVMLDRLGVLGLEERAVTWEKLLGIALLAAGTVLVVRE
jgi:transporter family-2 protein